MTFFGLLSGFDDKILKKSIFEYIKKIILKSRQYLVCFRLINNILTITFT